MKGQAPGAEAVEHPSAVIRAALQRGMAERGPRVRGFVMKVPSQDGRSGYSSKVTNNSSLIAATADTEHGAHTDAHAMSSQCSPLSRLT